MPEKHKAAHLSKRSHLKMDCKSSIYSSKSCWTDKTNNSTMLIRMHHCCIATKETWLSAGFQRCVITRAGFGSRQNALMTEKQKSLACLINYWSQSSPTSVKQNDLTVIPFSYTHTFCATAGKKIML